MTTNTEAIAACLAAHTPIGTRYQADAIDAAFQEAERELGARIGFPALVYHQVSAPALDDTTDIQSALDRLEALVDKESERASMQAQITRLQGHARYVWSQLRGAYARNEAQDATIAALRAELAQARVHVQALVAKEEAERGELDNVVDYLASEIESMDCSAGNFDGGSAWACEHCQAIEWMNKIDALTSDSELTASAARAWLRKEH